MDIFTLGIGLAVSVFLFVLGLVLLLSVFGLPGNWLMLGLVAVCHFALPFESPLGLAYWLIVVVIAIVGEVAEFLLQVRQAKKYGSSNTGTVGGVLGAIVGAILLAPLFFGIGAFIGALLGAYVGCLLFELVRGSGLQPAARAALGAMFGRFLGTVCKLACGAVIWAVTLQYLWPDPANLPFDFPWLPDAPNKTIPKTIPKAIPDGERLETLLPAELQTVLAA